MCLLEFARNVVEDPDGNTSNLLMNFGAIYGVFELHITLSWPEEFITSASHGWNYEQFSNSLKRLIETHLFNVSQAASSRDLDFRNCNYTYTFSLCPYNLRAPTKLQGYTIIISPSVNPYLLRPFHFTEKFTIKNHTLSYNINFSIFPNSAIRIFELPTTPSALYSSYKTKRKKDNRFPSPVGKSSRRGIHYLRLSALSDTLRSDSFSITHPQRYFQDYPVRADV